MQTISALPVVSFRAVVGAQASSMASSCSAVRSFTSKAAPPAGPSVRIFARRSIQPTVSFSSRFDAPLLQSSISRTSARPANTFFYTQTSRSYATAANPSSTSTLQTLTWNRFLELRKTRRRISLSSSIVCSVIVLTGGMSTLLASGFEDTAAAQLGLDPLVVLGLSSAGLVAAGWLIGPAFGNLAFNTVYRGYKGGIETKERDFFKRIQKHRADPSTSTLANPIPDYYGEKIGSVGDYRRWLRDQRAHRLKSGRML